MVKRRHDADREQRRTATLDQPDQNVQIHGALARELLCQRSVKPGLA